MADAVDPFKGVGPRTFRKARVKSNPTPDEDPEWVDIHDVPTEMATKYIPVTAEYVTDNTAVSLEVMDPMWMARAGEPAWPEWVRSFRDTQLDACDEIIRAFDSGARVVFLDAPTGSGKTLLAEMVRRRLATTGVYVCSSKSLQDQFLTDYPYARVLKGRANYPTEVGLGANCGDCTGAACRWCHSKDSCPYGVAKVAALRAPVAVLNTAYFLAETNVDKSSFSGAELVVVDEADTLEASLMGAVEIRFTARVLDGLGLRTPVKGARAKTVRRWLADDVLPAVRVQIRLTTGADVDTIRAKKRLVNMLSRARLVVAEMDAAGVEDEVDGGAWGTWVRDYDDRHTGDFIMKPVRVDGMGDRRVWRHAARWLCMSATIISAEEQADSLGLDQAGVAWDVVKVPMAFPVENRLVKYRPVAPMVYKSMKDSVPMVAARLGELLTEHAADNVLVHTVSYGLTKWLVRELRRHARVGQFHSYGSAGERDRALADFKREGGVMFAPSLDRGIDLPGDLCRVQVVAKMPYQSLADRQISERMKMPGGQLWYGVQTARSLVQMTGRAVRSDEDHAVSYILDSQFEMWWGNVGRRVMPGWWTEALR